MNIDKQTLETLIGLITLKKSAADTLTDAIAVVSEKLQIKKSVIRAYINAIYDDKLNELSEDVDLIRTLIDGKDEGKTHA